jgi:transposase
MFALSSDHRFLLYSGAVDMRKGFDGLGGDPCSGDVFVFINRGRDKAKLMHWQGGGFVLYYKRLESGRFQLPAYDQEVGCLKLEYSHMVMVMVIDGLSITNVGRRKKYTKTPEKASSTTL